MLIICLKRLYNGSLIQQLHNKSQCGKNIEINNSIGFKEIVIHLLTIQNWHYKLILVKDGKNDKKYYCYICY